MFSFQSVFLALISAAFLILLYPEVNFGFLAWISLIPFLHGVAKVRTRARAAGAGLCMGLLFFAVSLFWLTEVSWFGWVFLTLMESLNFMWWGILVFEGRKISNWFVRMIWVSSSWTLLEWVRTEIPVWGFGWNLLAYSQADHAVVRQIANFFGAYGLGFLIVWVNCALYQVYRHQWALYKMNYWRALFKGRAPLFELKQPGLNLGLLLLVIAGIWTHGAYYLNHQPDYSQTLKVSVIQANIPQSVKWQLMAKEEILTQHLRLVEKAAVEKPDLIVWPEAAFPGYFNADFMADQVKSVVIDLAIPMLIGAPHSGSQEQAFNSAYLMDAKGEILGRYDKQYLVPFGEYVPWKSIFGWLEPLAYAMGVSNFSAGSLPTVFPFKEGQAPFSALICFEDLFPSLVRKFRAEGAQFLVVITNDAWFGQTAAPFQHLQASVFRAIENGVPVVRAANTGVSGFISRTGEVMGTISDAEGRQIFIPGAKTDLIYFDAKPTFYSELGFLFPFGLLALFIGLFLKERSKKRGSPLRTSHDVEQDEA